MNQRYLRVDIMSLLCLLLASTAEGFVLPSARPRTSAVSLRAPSIPPPVMATEGVDVGSLIKYPVATAFEFSLIAACLRGVDLAVGTLPAPFVPFIFAFLSLRSRLFSPISARRPPRGGFEGKATPTDIKRPSWTPPGIAFPFIWLTITGLRASSALVVWRASGRTLFCAPLLTLVAHLCIGDTWNCVTNVEKRLGVSSVGVLFVLSSVYKAVLTFYAAAPLAGLLLAPSAVWISIASVLTWTIWSINTPRQPLLPRQDGKASALQVPLLGPILESKPASMG